MYFNNFFRLDFTERIINNYLQMKIFIALLSLFILSGCGASEYDRGYEEGYIDAGDEIDRRSKSFSSGYYEGYDDAENQRQRQY